jgi:glycyl-tRNA synthetase
LPIALSAETLEECLGFVGERLRHALLERGHRYDIVDAVLAAQGSNPARADRAVRALDAWVRRPDWGSILPAFARCVRITRDLEERFLVDPASLVEPAEVDLHARVQGATDLPRSPGSVDDFLNAFQPLIPAINRFFDEVLVMTEDRKLRENRLGLLQQLAALTEGVADMGKLEGF